MVLGMRIYFFYIFCFTLIFSETHSEITKINSNINVLILEFRPKLISFQEIESGQEKFFIPLIENAHNIETRIGKPQQFAESVLITVSSPKGFTISFVEISNIKSFSYTMAATGIDLPNFNNNSRIYQQENRIPDWISLEYIGISRGRHIARLSFIAARWNYETRQIEIPEKITVKINFTYNQQNKAQILDKFAPKLTINHDETYAFVLSESAPRTQSQRLTDLNQVSNGNWLRLTITDEGLYRLDANQLAARGFRVPADLVKTIKLFGHGGANLSEKVSDGLQNDMYAYEIMLSESQERMLAVIHKGKEEIARKICEKWDVPFTHIGYVTEDGLLRISRNNKQVAEIPAESLVLGGGAPQYDREWKRPAYLDETENFDTSSFEKEIPSEQDFWSLLSSPTIASKRWVYEQYDSQVRTNTVSARGDAAVIRLKELPGKAIALSTDCNSRYTYLNPYAGAMAAVCEAARNVVCVGAKPVAITNCLNFGNPYDPEVYYQFREAIRGMGDACRRLDTPVTGGNVSFHNESQNYAIFPTPTIGMLGVIDDLTKVISMEFKNEGDLIFLIGNNRSELGGSEFLKYKIGKITGKAPIIDIDEEIALQNALLEMIENHLISSAHDTSEGGLAVCLAEKSIASSGLACKVHLDLSAGHLFGESQSRVVISAKPHCIDPIKQVCKKYGVSYYQLGKVTKEIFEIEGFIKTSHTQISRIYNTAIKNLMKK